MLEQSNKGATPNGPNWARGSSAHVGRARNTNVMNMWGPARREANCTDEPFDKRMRKEIEYGGKCEGLAETRAYAYDEPGVVQAAKGLSRRGRNRRMIWMSRAAFWPARRL